VQGEGSLKPGRFQAESARPKEGFLQFLMWLVTKSEQTTPARASNEDWPDAGFRPQYERIPKLDAAFGLF
jgi:hypothetical protein